MFTKIQISLIDASFLVLGGKNVMKCAFCGGRIIIEGQVGRQDTCPHCNRDLRCCIQCKFFDRNAYNECREVSAERIIDKERANFCDHYVLSGTKGHSGQFNRNRDAREALEALFKK